MACQLFLTSTAMCIPRERLWSHRGRVSPPACGPRSGPALCPSLHHSAYSPSVPTAIHQYAPACTSLGATVQPWKNMPTARAPADAQPMLPVSPHHPPQLCVVQQALAITQAPVAGPSRGGRAHHQLQPLLLPALLPSRWT